MLMSAPESIHTETVVRYVDSRDEIAVLRFQLAEAKAEIAQLKKDTADAKEWRDQAAWAAEILAPDLFGQLKYKLRKDEMELTRDVATTKAIYSDWLPRTILHRCELEDGSECAVRFHLSETVEYTAELIARAI